MSLIKVYQLRRPKLIVEKKPQRYYQGKIEVLLIATMQGKCNDPEPIWDCCNNSCWYSRKDWKSMKTYRRYNVRLKVQFTDQYRGYCNSDIIVDLDGEFWCAEDFGWHKCDTLEDAIQYHTTHSHWLRLESKSTQFPTGREHTAKQLAKYKEHYEAKGIRCWYY